MRLGGALGRLRAARALASVLVLLLLAPLLTAPTSARTYREPGVLPGNDPGEGVVTIGDLARLRSQPRPPALTARSAILWDVTNGAELYAKAPDARIPPASTAKMLSALLVLEHGRLDQQVTVVAADFGAPDESRMGLAVGDTVTVEDLLYGMLMASGGDAARAAARTVGASLLAGAPGDPMARFVQEMNARAARLGLTNSRFVNPDGDDAPGLYSSARDLLTIAVEALKNPFFARLVETQQATRTTVDRRTTFALTNTNELLGARPGVHGVKTGTTEGCGQCLVTAQWTANGRLIAVVMGSADRYADTTALLDYANAAYRWVPLGQGAEQPGLAPALARWGVAFRERRVAVVPSWEAPTLRYRLLLDPPGGAPANRDAPRGKVLFLAGSREVLSLPVYAVR
jgi:D-alanyl-D-alanine carboxypeptidase (penicillin-binding protein 5/6)